jgi:hypothetical protein
MLQLIGRRARGVYAVMLFVVMLVALSIRIRARC